MNYNLAELNSLSLSLSLSLCHQALRVSLEEQRQRVEDETRRVQQESLEQMQTGEEVGVSFLLTNLLYT